MLYIALFLVSFFFSLISIHFYRKLNESRKIAIGVDINKEDQRKICEGTGIALLSGIWFALAVFFAFKGIRIELIAWGLLLSIFSVIGFIDDAKPKFVKSIIGWRARALPIGLIAFAFAFFFSPNIFWVIPIALYIAGLASFENTFAGLNGWSGGSGLIIAIASSILLFGTPYFSLGLILVASIIAFLCWNKYPSRVLEGDAGTLLIGSAIAGLFVLTKQIHLMAFSLLFFIPHIIDFFFLKMLTNPKDATQQKMRPYALLKDGRIATPEYSDKRIRYDFAKLVIRIFDPLKEWKIVLIIWIIVALNCVLWLAVYSKFF